MIDAFSKSITRELEPDRVAINFVPRSPNIVSGRKTVFFYLFSLVFQFLRVSRPPVSRFATSVVVITFPKYYTGMPERPGVVINFVPRPPELENANFRL